MELKSNQVEKDNTGENNKRRKKVTKRKRIKIRAFIVAISIILLTGGAYGYTAKSKKDKTKYLLEQSKIEKVLDKKEFKLSYESPNFIDLMENSGYVLAESAKEFEGFDKIYSMYEYAWALKNATEKENIEMYQEEINNNFPQFVASLKDYLSARVPGDLSEVDIFTNNNITSTRVDKDTEWMDSSLDLSSSNQKNTELNEETEKVFNIEILQSNTDMQTIINTIKVYEEGQFTRENLVPFINDTFQNSKTSADAILKVISAVMRTSCKDYILTYDKVKEGSNFFTKEEATTYNGELREIDDIKGEEKINNTLNNLKKYLKSYYGINSDIENLRVTTISGIWKLVDDETGTTYPLNESVVEMCETIVSCQNQIKSMHTLGSESMISTEEYDECYDPTALQNINKTLKIRK